jgi:hypothetical protein
LTTWELLREEKNNVDAKLIFELSAVSLGNNDSARCNRAAELLNAMYTMQERPKGLPKNKYSELKGALRKQVNLFLEGK